MNIPWWGYVILAGLSWGTYVPIIFFGGSELGGKSGSRLAAIMCVGVAYVVLAVIFPLIVFMLNQQDRADVNMKSANGFIFAGLAGVMGAVGAICVVFASKEAMGAGTNQWKESVAAVEKQREEAASEAEKEQFTNELEELKTNDEAYTTKYRILIAPLIFSIAPIINTLLSSLWHPKAGNWRRFYVEMPPPLFWLGILLVAVGTGLILYAKESGEVQRKLEEKKQAAEAKLNFQGKVT